MEYKYIIKQVSEHPDWEQIEPLYVENYCWGGEYRPKVAARVAFIPEKGFSIKLDCEESNPKAVFTENNRMVCKDSCLEAFLNFKPEQKNAGYINFETNARGALYSAYGEQRNNRTFLCDMGIKDPVVFTCNNPSDWSAEIFVPLTLIEKVYGRCEFKSGDVIKGNFYKCGDETEIEHYGSWTVIDNPTPDFHRPENFGTLIIE